MFLETTFRHGLVTGLATVANGLYTGLHYSRGAHMAGSRRTVPLPPGWHAVATAILARDPVCRWGILAGEDGYCHSDSTEVDHTGTAWDHRPEVLRGICHIHHVARTSRQANAAKAARRALRYRPADNHPGYVKGTGEGTALSGEGTAVQEEGTALPRKGGLRCCSLAIGGPMHALLYALLIGMVLMGLLSLRRY